MASYSGQLRLSGPSTRRPTSELMEPGEAVGLWAACPQQIPPHTVHLPACLETGAWLGLSRPQDATKSRDSVGEIRLSIVSQQCWLSIVFLATELTCRMLF